MEEEIKLLGVPNYKKAEARAKPANRRPLIIGIVVAILFGGGALYAWQNSASEVSIGELTKDSRLSQVSFDGMLGGLEDRGDINESSLAAVASTEDLSDLGVGAESEEPKEDGFLELLAPNGGETFCLGEQLDIQWEHKGVERIQFYLYREGEDAMHGIGMFSAGFEKDQQLKEEVYVQEVKEGSVFVPEEGSDYRVRIVDEDNPFLVDTSDAVFAIENCAS